MKERERKRGEKRVRKGEENKQTKVVETYFNKKPRLKDSSFWFWSYPPISRQIGEEVKGLSWLSHRVKNCQPS